MSDPYREIYSYNGMNNNLKHPHWGAMNKPRARLYPPIHGYEDDLITPSSNLPSARRIMEDIFRMATPKEDKHTNHLLLEFGHFMVNDIVQSAPDPNASFPIPCDGKLNDIMFCPAVGQFFTASQISQMNRNGTLEIPFHRMTAQDGTLPRAPLNTETSYLDLSSIYGKTPEEVRAVRGKHKSGGIDYDENNRSENDQDPNAPYLGGMNSSPTKYAFYILFIRYHNLRAAYHANLDPWLSSDAIFDRARMDTIAVYQNIIEEKYIPTLLGDTLEKYTGYDPNVNPSVDIFFAAVAFRYGHSAFSMKIPVVDKYFQPIVNTILVRDVFKQNVPQLVEDLGGIEPFLRGAVITPSHAVDLSFVDDMNLWSDAISVIDIQRARDNGIPPYNVVREAFNLSQVFNFTNLTNGDILMAQSLERLYENDISKVDAYIGALLEKPEGALNMLGPVLTKSLKNQFTRLRDGDRLWYKSRYLPEEYESFPTLSELVKLVCKDDEMKNFPKDAFIKIDPEDTGTSSTEVCSDSSSSISLLEGALGIFWTLHDAGRHTIDSQSVIYLTLEANEALEKEGFIGIGWRSDKMKGAEIWFCTVDQQAFENFEKSSQCGAPTFDATFDVSDKGVDMNNVATNLFSCCVAKGETHVKPECASPDDVIYYPLRVVDSCLSDEGASVTIQAYLCNDEDGSKIGQPGCMNMTTENGKMEYIAAYNPVSRSRPHGSSRRVSGEINLASGRATILEDPVASESLFAIHGLVLLFSWMIVAPIAIFIVRFMKHKSWRLVAHVTLLELVGSMTFPLLLSALAIIQDSNKTAAHRLVGIYLTASLALMVLAGSIRLLNIENPKLGRKLGKVVNMTALTFHRVFGYVILFLAWFNCYTGLIRIGPTAYVEIVTTGTEPMGYDVNAFGIIRKYIFWPYVALWITIFTVAEIKRQRMTTGPERKKQIKAVLNGTGTIWKNEWAEDGESMTMETFLQLTRHGSDFCIVDGRVLDIGSFVDQHPGGREVLRFAQGCDITKEILGEQDVGGVKHIHSPFALNRMERLAIARLRPDDSVNRSLTDLGGKSSRGLVKDDEIFHQARIIGMKFLTPQSEDEDHATVWMKLEVDLRKDKEYQTGLTQQALFPSSAFTFRGWDDRDLTFERQYTPIILDKAIEDSPTSLVSKTTYSKHLQYDFIISLVQNGAMSEFFKTKKQDKLLLVQGPKVNLQNLEKIDSKAWENVLLVASGTGIAPMIVLVDYYLDLFEKKNEQTDFERSDCSWNGPQLSLVWILKSPKHNYTETLDLERRAERARGFFRWVVVYPERLARRRSSLASIIPNTAHYVGLKFQQSKILFGKNGKINLGNLIDLSRIRDQNHAVPRSYDAEKDEEKDEKGSNNFWSYSGKCISRKLDDRLFQHILSSCKRIPISVDSVCINFAQDFPNVPQKYSDSFCGTLVAVSGSPSFDHMVLEHLENLGIKHDQIMTFYGADVPVSSLKTNKQFQSTCTRPANPFSSTSNVDLNKNKSTKENYATEEMSKETNMEEKKEVDNGTKETTMMLPVKHPSISESLQSGLLWIDTVDTPHGHGERMEIVIGCNRTNDELPSNSFNKNFEM